MEQFTGVKNVEFCHVAPPPSSAEISLPLSFYDILWLSPDTFYETTLPRLKKSLSNTLAHYLPLSGNLVWEPESEKPFLHFVPGDGVSLIVAESQADFHYLSSDVFRKSEELHPLLPDLPPTDTKVAVISLQVTFFPNKGFSIGYATHHAVLDGKTLAMFTHSWAFFCRGNGDDPILAPDFVPNYDRTIVEDPAREKHYLNGWIEHNGPGNKSLMYWNLKPDSDTMLATFCVSYETIEKLKKSVLAMWDEETDTHVSTFSVVSAWILVCLVKSQKLEAQTVMFAFAADGRGRKGLDPPVPSNYFGNCLLRCKAEIESEKLKQDDGLAIAAKEICYGLKKLDAQASRKEESSEGTLLSLPKGKIYSVGGSPRFDYYKVDFGWGRPKKVELVSIDKSGAFSLCDSRDETSAIEIGVAMKEHEIDDFASLFGDCFEI